VYWVLAAVVSYALGSINSAIAVSWLLYRDDIRRHGSGNAGASNMFRTYGRTAALLTLLGDMFKTLAAVTLTRLLFRWIAGGDPGFDPGWFAGLFAILGHVFPIWFGFRGGKGVLVAAVTVLAVDPAAFGVMAVLAIVVFALWHTMSIVSLVSAGLLPIVIFVLGLLRHRFSWIEVCFSVVYALLVLWSHRGNIQRIRTGEEQPLREGRSDPEDPSNHR
jgi:glycerol-3-phosphate acyltransferase PlsY